MTQRRISHKTNILTYNSIKIGHMHLKCSLNYYYLIAKQLFLQTAASPRQNQMIQCKVYDIIFIYFTEMMLIPWYKSKVSKGNETINKIKFKAQKHHFVIPIKIIICA